MVKQAEVVKTIEVLQRIGILESEQCGCEASYKLTDKAETEVTRLVCSKPFWS